MSRRVYRTFRRWRKRKETGRRPNERGNKDERSSRTGILSSEAGVRMRGRGEGHKQAATRTAMVMMSLKCDLVQLVDLPPLVSESVRNHEVLMTKTPPVSLQ